jgi:DNA-binding PadR family transcriptional regulator
LTEDYKEEIVQRITRNLLDIQIMRLIRTQPMWGYRIKKFVETRFGVRLRHGVLYPLLNELERKDFLKSQRQQQGRRVRKVYSLTRRGIEYVETYEVILKEQIGLIDVE